MLGDVRRQILCLKAPRVQLEFLGMHSVVRAQFYAGKCLDSDGVVACLRAKFVDITPQKLCESGHFITY